AVAGDVVVIGDGLAGDEAALEVVVDDGGGLGGLGAGRDGPGTGFLGADREVGDQAQQRVAGADNTIEATIVQPEPFEELGALFLGQLGDLGLDGGGDDHGASALGLCPLGNPG